MSLQFSTRLYSRACISPVLLAVLFCRTALAHAEVQLPGRCQRSMVQQRLDSPSYIDREQPLPIQRIRRKCRTYIRKNFIRQSDKGMIAAAESYSLHLRATENELLTVDPPAASAKQNILWALRFNGELYFSTDVQFAVRFPDNGKALLRLWLRDRSSGQIARYTYAIDIANSAPVAHLQIPERIRAGRRAIVSVQVEDPGITDRRSGFSYLWKIEGEKSLSVESASSTLEYRFPDPGTYTIYLQVSDQDGGSSFINRQVSVLARRSATPETGGPQQHTPDENPTPLAPEDSEDDSAPELPQLTGSLRKWEQQMIQYGRQHCETLGNSSASDDERLGTTYYDVQWIYFQIADYTGDDFWITCAQRAEGIYRDGYVADWSGRVPGYWNFTHGLLEDFRRTGDLESRAAVIELSHMAAFTADETPLEWTVDVETSREVAYAIMSYINAEKAGAPRRERLTALYSQALGHMDQWFGAGTAPYIRPFMVALTAQALIEYDELIGDPAIVGLLEHAFEQLWEDTWLPAEGTFQYTDREHASGGTEPAYDLNLLIAPVYAWLYHKTGKIDFLNKADLIFEGGVRNAWLVGGKQFNQQYRWSFKYLSWRQPAS